MAWNAVYLVIDHADFEQMAGLFFIINEPFHLIKIYAA